MEQIAALLERLLTCSRILVGLPPGVDNNTVSYPYAKTAHFGPNPFMAADGLARRFRPTVGLGAPG